MMQSHVFLSVPKHYIPIQVTLLGMHHRSHVLPQTIIPIQLTLLGMHHYLMHAQTLPRPSILPSRSCCLSPCIVPGPSIAMANATFNRCGEEVCYVTWLTLLSLKGILHLWALFLKTFCIFSKNKATLDKETYGSGQKCSKELKNHIFTSVEAIYVKLQ